MGKHSQSVDTLILRRISSRGAGRVFTASDFHDLGSRDAVDQALSRHARAGAIRKLARGLYDLPRRDPQLGLLLPSVDAIVDALRGRDAVRLQPTGAYAANLLGLSDQVPMRIVFLTDGIARQVRIGKQQIVLKRTTPRNMATAGRVSGLVIQGLRHLGRQAVHDQVVNVLRSRLSADDKRQLLRDVRLAPAWVADVMRRVAAEPES
jgi:hypothetical protein